MQKTILMFDKMSDNTYQTIFRNNHGRKIYIKLQCKNDDITICDCFYIDRPIRNGVKAIPHKLKTMICKKSYLPEVIANELDRKFYEVIFSDDVIDLSDDEYIKSKLLVKDKYKFLILVKNDDVLRTRLKNRVHRSIYLEIKRNDNGRSIIQKCCYYDRLYKRNNVYITPVGLNTIFFEFSKEKILEIINNELNCDFTDIIITNDTFGFDNNNIPICGSI